MNGLQMSSGGWAAHQHQHQHQQQQHAAASRAFAMSGSLSGPSSAMMAYSMRSEAAIGQASAPYDDYRKSGRMSAMSAMFSSTMSSSSSSSSPSSSMLMSLSSAASYGGNGSGIIGGNRTMSSSSNGSSSSHSSSSSASHHGRGGGGKLSSGPHSEDGRRQSLYKTELCRSWEETQQCRYGAKCQFAHGKDELRSVARHPRYKTEICKTFHTIGTCPYGKRCRFVHLEGLPHYWSPSSPLNYLIFYQAAPSESDFSVDDYFGAVDVTAALPPTPSALFSSFQEEKAKALQLRNGGATREAAIDAHHAASMASASAAYGADGGADSGEGPPMQAGAGGLGGGANDHQPLIVKPIEAHLGRLRIFADISGDE